MQCDFYQKFEMGELTNEVFVQHEQNCPACQRAARQDRELLQMTRQLDQPVEAPLLWAKIENRLRQEQRAQNASAANIRGFAKRHSSTLLRLAAMLVVAIGIGAYFFANRTAVPQQGVLTASALAKIEVKEREYENAISELEELIEPKFSQMDVDLMLLYRDRLETIDSQILHCKEALTLNPANAHIRRYLLAALQDKQETLREVNNWRAQARLN